MLNLIIAQIGYKPAKKSDQDRTVFLKDSANHFFEANTGLGIDLTARLAEKWFAEVVATKPEAMAMIQAEIDNPESRNHCIALDLELGEDQKFKRGIAVSFNTMVMYLRLIGIIECQEQIASNHKDESAGCIYVIKFKV